MCTKVVAARNNSKPAESFSSKIACAGPENIVSVLAPMFQEEHCNPPMRAWPRDAAGALATAPDLDEDAMAQSDILPKASMRIGPLNGKSVAGHGQNMTKYGHALAMFFPCSCHALATF